MAAWCEFFQRNVRLFLGDAIRCRRLRGGDSGGIPGVRTELVGSLRGPTQSGRMAEDQNRRGRHELGEGHAGQSQGHRDAGAGEPLRRHN